MMQSDKFEKIPEWKKSEINRWADFIELSCIFSKDKIIAREDLLSFLDDKYSDMLLKGTEEHSGEFDKLNQRVSDYFSSIEYRLDQLTDYYPFSLDEGDCLSVLPQQEWTKKHEYYLFLLFCSSIPFFDGTTRQKLTNSFEIFCKDIMIFIMPHGAHTELFGTSKDNSYFVGNLRKRIEKLANCLGTNTTRSFDDEPKYDNIFGGDDGIDIVSFIKIDNASHIPFAFAQCTCSYDKWKDKQNSISISSWRKRIEGIPSGWKFMMVPFVCHSINGNFEEELTINTCLIDRERILKLCAKNKDAVKYHDWEQLSKEIFEEMDGGES